MTESELINLLLENCKEEKAGNFIPNEVTLKVSELNSFDVNIAEKISKIIVPIFSKTFSDVNGFHRKDNYTKTLIQYSLEEDYITFFPSILKTYNNEK